MNRLVTLFSVGILVSSLLPVSGHAALIASWSGDNTAVDGTGNGHDGTVTNASYTAGVVGDAFSFDGTGGVVTVPANVALEPTTISISLWVQSALEDHLRVLIDSTHGAGQAGWAVQINQANNVTFAYGNGSGFPELAAAAGLGDGEFHHIAATLDGSTMRLYVDGGTPVAVAYSGTPTPSTRDIQIGNSPILNRPLEGSLDEIRIYNHVLSHQEIIALSSVPEPVSMGLLSIGAILLGGGRLRCR